MLLAPQWLWLMVPLIYIYVKRPRLTRYDIYMYIAMTLVIVALSRPVYNPHTIEMPVTGSDVIIALDLSYSMQAEDIQPDRLSAAKQLLEDIVRHDLNNRFGVVAFTSNAIILSPLTRDSELLLNLVHRLDERMVVTKGTSLLPALELARKMSHAARPKVLLFTDGGDADSYVDVAAYAQKNNLQVSIVMLATALGATLLQDDGTLLKDASDHIVVSSQNRAVEAISRATGGSYLVQPDADTLMALLASQHREDFKDTTTLMRYGELFYLCIALALLFFMLAHTFLGSRIHTKILALLLLFGVNTDAGVLDAYYLYSAKQAYAHEAYMQAAESFLHVNSDKARYNAAVSHYRAGAYEKALALFESIQSHQSDFKAMLYYNRAVCYIRLQDFAQARENLVKSLTLKFDRQAYENWRHIYSATKEKRLLQSRQHQKHHDAVTTSSPQQRNKQGGSNMNVTASASSGASEQEKKQHSEAIFSLEKKRAKLSSRQYELINERGVHETAPW